jgi:two-component system chemotaxis response regulator CheY
MRKPLNLLVVDDSVMMRAMVKRAVGLAGVPLGEIHEASNGAEALDVLMRAPIDAIFTDINMPVMTGIELLQMVGREERWRHVLRVVISTEGLSARREQEGRLGECRFVEKPFKPEDIRDVLAALL